MNRKHKVLTIVTLPVFLLLGLFLLVISGENGYGGIYTGWFALGVVYAAFFFLLKPSKPE